jgi:hypothetical protein
MRRDYNDDFYDDQSDEEDVSDDKYRYDSQYDEPGRKSIYSGYFSKKPKRQTEATLGGLLGSYGNERDTVFTQKSIGTIGGFLGNYGTDTIKAESEYAESEYNTSANVEKQVANLTYVDPPKPLYDPNNMKEGNVSPVGGMIVPRVVELNTKNYADPIRNVHPVNTSNNFTELQHFAVPPGIPERQHFAVPRGEHKPNKREQRIRALKNEIDELDLKVESEEIQDSKRCCGCCPTSRKGKLIVLFIVLFFLVAIGIVAFILWPKFPEFKVTRIETKQGEPINIALDLNKLTVQYVLNLTVEVANNNRFDIFADTIDISTYISPNMEELGKTKFPGSTVTGKVDDYLVGEAKVEQIEFFAYRRKKFFADLYVDFDSGPFGVVSNPILGEILRVCTPEAIARNDTLKIVYIVDVKIGILQKLGFSPKIVDIIPIGCPVGAKKASEMFKVFTSAMNSTQTNSTQTNSTQTNSTQTNSTQ